ncbi:MAG: hypothetical protein AB7U99_12705, partial [Steroidobacteraceae bacterium]
ILAAVVAVAYFLERRDNTKHEAWYWLAIILIRTGATNIADFVSGRRFLGVNRILFSTALAVFIAAMVIYQHKKNDKPGLPATDANYWITMLAAGVFGTAAGDAVRGAFGDPEAMGGVYAAAILTAILAVLLLFGRSDRIQKLYYSWLTICVARTAGTAIADMLAGNQTLNIGLVASTIMTGIVFVGVLVLWKSRPREQAAMA